MGMYDNIICNTPLPGDPPAFAGEPGRAFQTKSLGCEMATYEITAAGRLAKKSSGWIDDRPMDEDTNHHGTVEFYDSNWRGTSDEVSFTEGGEDLEQVTYLATFIHGQLSEVEEVERTREKALPASEMDSMRQAPPTPAERVAWEARVAESLVGRSMYRARGTPDGSFGGEPVEVVAEGPHEWAIRWPDGSLEIVGRTFRDHLLFDSEAEAREEHEGRRSGQEARKARYAGLLAGGPRRPAPDPIGMDDDAGRAAQLEGGWPR